MTTLRKTMLAPRKTMLERLAETDDEKKSKKPSLTRQLLTIQFGSVLIVLAAATIPAILAIWATSDLTPAGRHTYEWLAHPHGRVVGARIHKLACGIGVCLVVFGFFFDLKDWGGKWHYVTLAYYCLAGFIFGCGVLFYTATAPSIPIMIGIVSTVLPVVAIRTYHLTATTIEDYSLCVSIAFFILFLVTMTIWVFWAFTPFLGGYNTWNAEIKADFAKRGFRMLTGLLIWCAPFLYAAAFGLISLFTVMRSRFHVPEQGAAAGDGVYVGGELKLVTLFLLLIVLSMWIAASVSAQDLGLAKTVVRLSGFMFVALIAYVSLSIGMERIRKAAKDDETIQGVLLFCHSDWMKGLFMLVVVPLLPFYFGLEVVHEFIRKGLTKAGAVDSARDRNGGRWLTKEAGEFWDNMQEWSWPSVLTKSMWVGILYFAIQVGVSQGITIFLSWLNEKISPWPLWAILAILFMIGIFLFLLPPVPGLPIYLVSGIVVVQRCINDGISFFWGCVIAIIFCFIIKMTAITLQQKVIGEQFSDSVAIKKVIGIQTPTMKAVRHILSQKGVRADKVAVLIGGPDWPTSVLTGILKLHLSDMLLGSTPCFFLILPVVLASAFMIRAAQEPEKAQQYQCIANVMMMIAALVQTTSMIVAGYYMQACKDEFAGKRGEHDTFPEEPDKQEKDVLASVAIDELRAVDEKEKTRWDLMPGWLKGVLVCGSVLMSLMMHIVIDPLPIKPFKDFTLSDSVSAQLNGNALNVINPSGWLAIGLLTGACICLTTYRVWCSSQLRIPVEEMNPLTMPLPASGPAKSIV